MARDPRYFRPFTLVEVTCVTLQNRHLLRPSEKLNDLFVGVLARAQRKIGMDVVCVTALSSHWHALLIPRDPKALADFMCFVNTNLSKEIGKAHQWSGALFADRYHHIPVSDEEGMQIQRLKYCLANSVKEFLVDRVSQWPGVHSADALVEGAPLAGHWYNRTKGYAARQLRGEKGVRDEDFATEEQLVFSPLPCWAHLPETEQRRRVADLIVEIEEEAAQERRRTGKTSLGVEKILSADPHYRPEKVEKSPKPRFHALTAEVLDLMLQAWREVITAFREASTRLLSGERRVEFPEGTFPPHLPFVPFLETMTLQARGQPA